MIPNASAIIDFDELDRELKEEEQEEVGVPGEEGEEGAGQVVV